jgi:hypothetical protein
MCYYDCCTQLCIYYCRWEVPVGRPSIARPKPERVKGSTATANGNANNSNSNSTQQQEQTTPPKPIVVDGVTVAQVEIQVHTILLSLHITIVTTANIVGIV